MFFNLELGSFDMTLELGSVDMGQDPLQHSATHCNTLQQKSPVPCSSLSFESTTGSLLTFNRAPLTWDRTHCNTLQHPATPCNTLQHPATPCNTLQHTATHCNKRVLFRALRYLPESTTGSLLTLTDCIIVHHTATQTATHSVAMRRAPITLQHTAHTARDCKKLQ